MAEMTKPPSATKPPTTKLLQPMKLGKSPASATRQVKTFSISKWSVGVDGEKVCLYARTGMGKTTLGAMAPDAIFLAPDDGGRKILHPVTGQPCNKIDGLATFDDARDALHQTNLWPEKCTIVVDTFTKLEVLSDAYVLANYRGSKGEAVNSMRKFGWDGPAHTIETMRLILSDLDSHVRAGRNVVLLCQLGQITVANAEGADYLEDGPKLTHNKQYSVRSETCEWCDHVLKIGYNGGTQVEAETTRDGKTKVGKITGDGTRAIFAGGAQHFIAKTRPTKSGQPLPPVISFDAPEDDALWQFLFPN